MERYRNLTILHSNDLHGDFLSKTLDETLLGGISMLSGYVGKMRREEPNCVYCIAGDMLQGSIIDSEFLGISTIEIMNLLGPDVASIGNHEVDYGLAHLLFLERCARFPIVNANLFIKNPYIRLFTPYVILEVGGMKVMFIGIITNDIMMGIRQDALVSFVDVEDAACEVGHICNAYHKIDIDFTVLLTHIGFEEDKRLAALLQPEWGVDVIIGGHSHTILEQPEQVNDVLIVQAGVGTKQIGRFDIVVDTDLNAVHSYKWELVPIDSSHCPRNAEMEATIRRFKSETDKKYNRVLCRLARPLTHPGRYQETELGNLLTDLLRDSLDTDIVLLGSGSIRKQSVPTVFSYGELMELFPYDDRMLRLKVTGAQLRRMVRHTFRDEMLQGGHTEFYQYSHGVAIAFDKTKKDFSRFEFGGAPLEDERIYTVAIQGFHHKNFEACFGFDAAEIEETGKPVVLTTSIRDVLVEYLPRETLRDKAIEGRMQIQ